MIDAAPLVGVYFFSHFLGKVTGYVTDRDIQMPSIRVCAPETPASELTPLAILRIGHISSIRDTIFYELLYLAFQCFPLRTDIRIG
jgi:hypothetical protein